MHMIHASSSKPQPGGHAIWEFKIMLYLFDAAFQSDARAHNWVSLRRWRILCLLLRLPERPNGAHVARDLHKDRL